MERLLIAAGRSSGKKEVTNFALRQLDWVARTIRRCAALLKDKIVIRDVFNNSKNICKWSE